jgi:hypothetical protein
MEQAMGTRYLYGFVIVLILLNAPEANARPILTSETLGAWKTYVDQTERRIEAELKLTPVRLRSDIALLKSGRIQIQRVDTPGPGVREVEIPDGTVHHWFGAAFIPGITVESVIAWVQNYPQYQDYFKEVERSSIRARSGDTFEIFLRLTRSKLGVTAHFNTGHDVVYARRGGGFVSSVSRSTQIRQVKDAGRPHESEYPEGNDSGYLWRLNSYWRFNERDGGVVVESETIGLSRSLGWGLGLLNIFTLGKIKNIAESIARESLQDTLTALRNGVLGGPRKQPLADR